MSTVTTESGLKYEDLVEGTGTEAVITTDRSALQPVESVLAYQRRIPNSRLLVLQSDAYHVAVAKADECVSNVLEFITEATTNRKER